MKQYILTQFPWPWLPAIALVIFVTFFVGVVILTGLRSRRHLYEAAALLPLEEGTPHRENEV